MAAKSTDSLRGLAPHEALEGIVSGRHPDPFAILGPHKSGRATFVTAFDPGAAQLFAKQGDEAPRA